MVWHLVRSAACECPILAAETTMEGEEMRMRIKALASHGSVAVLAACLATFSTHQVLIGQTA
jgi:hypothetical protein